jgi:hypothetical protein
MSHGVHPNLTISKRSMFVTGSGLATERSLECLDQTITIGTAGSKTVDQCTPNRGALLIENNQPFHDIGAEFQVKNVAEEGVKGWYDAVTRFLRA